MLPNRKPRVQLRFTISVVYLTISAQPLSFEHYSRHFTWHLTAWKCLHQWSHLSIHRSSLKITYVKFSYFNLSIECLHPVLRQEKKVMITLLSSAFPSYSLYTWISSCKMWICHSQVYSCELNTTLILEQLFYVFYVISEWDWMLLRAGAPSPMCFLIY